MIPWKKNTPLNSTSLPLSPTPRSQFIVEFPRDATPDQRALLMAAVFQLEYQWYEKNGTENNNDN